MVMIAMVLAMAAADLQAVTMSSPPQPVPAAAPLTVAGPAEDSPEEIAQDAARDLKDSRFYNKPGATRAEYDAAWQECRLIARGSRTPSGSYTYVYNPAVISPLAAGIGAGIGSAIGAAIAEGHLRRVNRRTCLLTKGWRLVDVWPVEAARLATMTEAERDTYFNSIVGAREVKGEVTIWTNDFAAPRLAPESAQ